MTVLVGERDNKNSCQRKGFSEPTEGDGAPGRCSARRLCSRAVSRWFEFEFAVTVGIGHAQQPVTQFQSIRVELKLG